MTVHVLKLCVGVSSIEDLRERAARDAVPGPGGTPTVSASTRMAPKRLDEILGGGSLYWVIKGQVAARQRILAIEPMETTGVPRHRILLEAEVVAVRPRPCRPFQGWRYLKPQDAPADIRHVAVDDAMPAAMRADLMELCLI